MTVIGLVPRMIGKSLLVTVFTVMDVSFHENLEDKVCGTVITRDRICGCLRSMFRYNVCYDDDRVPEQPVAVHFDNVGDIFLGNNTKQSLRTKHIDVRYHVIREHIVDRMVKIVFVPSEENVSDVCTKNGPKDKYKEHTSKFMANMETISWKRVLKT